MKLLSKQNNRGFAPILVLITLVIIVIVGVVLFKAKVIGQPALAPITPMPAVRVLVNASASASPTASASAKVSVVEVQKSPSPKPTPSPKPSTPAPNPSTPAPEVQAAVSTGPGTTYQRKTVSNERGNFTVDLITVDLSQGAKIVTDSGSTQDCPSGCEAMPLADYVKRNGGFAGMNGTYFCPPDYSNCTNAPYSFHWFIFNYISKTFLNADKRDYSNAGSTFVFKPGSVQFIRNPLSYGMDTSISGAISSFPTLLADGQYVLDDSLMDDKQRNTKGNRGGLCSMGNTVMMMIVRPATVPDLLVVMQSLGCQNGINLDGGGSSAIYFNGYKVGPGRKLPNALVVVP